MHRLIDETDRQTHRHEVAILTMAQMSTLLNLEREAELTELWGDGGWQLSAAEARQVLALRVDFRKDTIAQLVLD